MYTVQDLKSEEYDPYFKHYLGLVDLNSDLFEVLDHSLKQTIDFLDDLKKPL